MLNDRNRRHMKTTLSRWEILRETDFTRWHAVEQHVEILCQVDGASHGTCQEALAYLSAAAGSDEDAFKLVEHMRDHWQQGYASYMTLLEACDEALRRFFDKKIEGLTPPKASTAPSRAQNERQRKRNSQGRYDSYLECDYIGCTKRLSEQDYWSDPRVDEVWNSGGPGLTLCQKHYNELQALDDVEAARRLGFEYTPNTEEKEQTGNDTDN